MSEFNISTADQPSAHRAFFASPEQRVASDQDYKTPKRNSGGQPGNQNARKKPDQLTKRGAPLGNQNAKTHGFRELCAPEPEGREGYAETPKKKRGAPLGNQNARTHGFYARRLPQSQLDGLENTTVRSLEDEIEVMRVFSRKVAELGAEVDDLGEAKSLLNTLANATGSINRLVRTHTHIPDPTLDPQWMLRHALEELEEEWPEYKAFGDQFRTPEEIAELDARIAARQARELAERQARAFAATHGEPSAPSLLSV